MTCMNKFQFCLFIAIALLGSLDAKVLLKGARNHDRKVAFLPSTRHLQGDGLLSKKLPKKRDCKLKSKDSDKVEFECKSVSDSSTDDMRIKDRIKFKVGTSAKGAGIQVEYANEVQTASEATETKTAYEISYDRLIEYVKGDNESESEAYDFENDEIVNTVDLQSWTPMSEVVTDDEGIISYFSADTADGLANFKFTISRASEGEAVTANKMKIDFTLTGYPWQRPGESYVALMSTVESGKEVKFEYDENAAEAAAQQDVAKTSSTLNDNGPRPKKVKRTKRVEISFGDAVEATSGITPFGEYNWVDFAEVSEMAEPTVNTTTEMDEGTTGTDEDSAPVDESSTGTAGGDGDINEQIGDGDGRMLQESDEGIPTEDDSTTTVEDDSTTTVEDDTTTMVEDDTTTTVEDDSTTKEDTTPVEGEEEESNSSGEEIQVVATSYVLDEETSVQTIAFSFIGRKAQNASKISWDPDVGIGYSEKSSSYRVGYFVTILASAVSTVIFLVA